MTRTLLSLLGLVMLWSCGSGRTNPGAGNTRIRRAAAHRDAEGPLKHRPAPTSPEIRAEDLMTRLYIFADDSMLGREAGTEGNVRGTNYLAAEAQRIGLLPAGENGSYFQTVPLTHRAADSSSTLTIDGSRLELNKDFIPAAALSVIPPLRLSASGGEPPGVLRRQVRRQPHTGAPRARCRQARGLCALAGRER